MFSHVFVPYVAIAAAVFFVVIAVLAFGLVRYRAGRGHEPSRKSKHVMTECLYAVALVGIAAFLATYVGLANAHERAWVAPRLHVTIVAYQWCWAFHYDRTPVVVTTNCDKSYPTLVVPTHEEIHFSLTSRDVVHEWWLPYIRYKEEAFPGHTNNFELTFDRSGEWEGRCDEFCGLYHDRMQFRVKAENPSAFAAWLRAEKARAASSSSVLASLQS